MAILTISRECKSGSHEIGDIVSEKLSYPFVSRTRILEDIAGYGKRWAAVDRDLDEKSPGIWEQYDWEYRGFIALVESILYAYALKDNVTIVGRGGNYLFSGIPHVLRIRLIAPLDMRIKRMMQKDGVDEKTAKAEISRIDNTRNSYIKKNYGKDWNNDNDYDMVFNSAYETYEEIAGMLIEALMERDMRKIKEGMMTLTGRADAAKIKAAVLTNEQVTAPTFNAVYDGSSIVLSGVVHTAREHSLIEKIASGITVCCPIISTIHYRG